MSLIGDRQKLRGFIPLTPVARQPYQKGNNPAPARLGNALISLNFLSMAQPLLLPVQAMRLQAHSVSLPPHTQDEAGGTKGRPGGKNRTRTGT